jgi:acetyl-CoA acyltransferase
MGQHAEMMAKINQISREAQDEFALRSHKNAARALEKGYLNDEIVPLWPSPKYVDCVGEDNLIRKDTDLASLAKLKPAFDRKYGTITAGNASPLTDGAAVCLIADEQRAKDLGLKPKTIIKDYLFLGVTPSPQLLIGPALAIPLLLKRNKLKLEDIDRFEIHEAFAAQVLSCLKMMDTASFLEEHLGESKALGRVPEDKLNVNGGAIAIGHPFGATGARLVMSLSNELIRSDKQLGVIAVCAAGGMSGAMLIERI